MSSSHVDDHDSDWRYEGLNENLYVATKVSSTIFSGISTTFRFNDFFGQLHTNKGVVINNVRGEE